MPAFKQEPYDLDPELLPWNSNDRFPEWTEDHIRILGDNTQTEIRELGGKIAQARALLDSLLLQYTQKTARLSFLRGAVSPLKQIPSEILGEIFIHCSDGKPTILPPNYISGPRFPWTLGQVSSHWREVLRETPHVWRNLEVAAVHSQTDATIDAAVDILSRVNTGLRLTIGTEIDVLNPISPLVLGFTERLSHLSIRPTHDLLFTFLGLPSSVVGALESIEMKFKDHWSVVPPVTTTVLHQAPKLTQVKFELKGMARLCPAELLFLPWGQLTKLSFINLSLPYDKAHVTLKQCSRLVTCNINVQNVAWNRLSQPRCERVVLPMLHSLTVIVSEINQFDWGEFLLPLEFPSLKDLNISMADGLEDRALISFLTHSKCALETLTWKMMSMRYIDSDIFFPVLTYIPSIRELIIPQHCLPPIIFDTLTKGNSHRLPNLRHIVCCVNPAGLHAFANLVESCIKEGPGRLESAIVTCWDLPGSEDVYDRFWRLEPGWVASGRNIKMQFLNVDNEYDYEYSDVDESEDEYFSDGDE